METGYTYTDCCLVVWNGTDPNSVMVHVCPRPGAVKDITIPLTQGQITFLKEHEREEWVPLALTRWQASQAKMRNTNDDDANNLDVGEVSTEGLMRPRDRVVNELDGRLRNHAV